MRLFGEETLVDAICFIEINYSMFLPILCIYIKYLKE